MELLGGWGRQGHLPHHPRADPPHHHLQLPRLQGATPAQQEAFDRFERALRVHEQGHVQWGRSAAQAIDAGIAALPNAATCASLEQSAHALGNRLLGGHMALEKDYDRRTGYGATQGAALP